MRRRHVRYFRRMVALGIELVLGQNQELFGTCSYAQPTALTTFLVDC